VYSMEHNNNYKGQIRVGDWLDIDLKVHSFFILNLSGKVRVCTYCSINSEECSCVAVSHR